MPQPPNDPVANAFAFGVITASIAAGLYGLSSSGRKTLLPRTPRRPVPWGAEAAFLACLLVVMAFMSAGEGKEPHAPLNTLRFMEGLLVELFIVGAVLFAIAITSRADRGDLGLPESLTDFKDNVLVGAAACLVALAPVLIGQR